jgi:hypothetical protein
MPALPDAFALGLAIAGLLVAAVSAMALRETWALYRGAPSRRLRELRADQVLVPPVLEKQAGELEGLGYEAIGLVGLDLPGQRSPGIERVLVSTDRTVQAEVVAPRDQPMVALLSLLRDGFVVETHYPERVRLVRDIVDLGGTQDSLQAAVELHDRRTAEHVQRHGAARRFETLNDVLAFDVDYRRRIGPTVLAGPTRKATSASFTGVAVGAAIAIAAVTSWQAP